MAYKRIKNSFGFIVLVICVSLSSCGLHKKSQTNKPIESARIPKENPNSSSAKRDNPEPKLKATAAEKESEKANSLMLFCEEWKGTPYKYGGCTKSGTDCSGFACQLYKEVYGLTLPRSSSEMVRTCIKVTETDLQEGDLVFFKINGKTISHVGVYLGYGNFIHASTKRGVIISNLSEDYYKKYFAQGGRF